MVKADITYILINIFRMKFDVAFPIRHQCTKIDRSSHRKTLLDPIIWFLMCRFHLTHTVRNILLSATFWISDGVQ